MIKEKLVDEESKIIYEALLEYSKTEDYISFWDNIKKILTSRIFNPQQVRTQ